MNIHTDNLLNIMTTWVEEVVVPKSGLVGKVLIYGGSFLFKNDINKMVDNIKLRIGEGYIDIDGLASAVNKAFTNPSDTETVTIFTNPLTGEPVRWTVDKSDVDKLFEIARRYAK